jgi:hypothetical protein
MGVRRPRLRFLPSPQEQAANGIVVKNVHGCFQVIMGLRSMTELYQAGF